MQKFFKKSLALALAAVLGLSAFTASAADSATIALGNAEITAPVADTTVKVPVTITGSNIAAVIFDVAVAEPLTLSDVDFKGEDANSDGVFENQNCTATICGNKVLVEAGTDEVVPAAAETLSLDLIVTVPASTPANSYSISISEVQACNNGSISVDDQGNTSFSDDVQLIAINTSATGGVVVKEPAPSHEHDFSGEWKYDETNHWKECVADGCTNPVAKDKEAAHTATGDWIIDVIPTADTEGSKYKKCSVCGGKAYVTVMPKTSEVSYMTYPDDTIYDIANEEFYLYYSYPSTGNMKDILAHAKKNGRKLSYVLILNDTTYEFEMDGISSGYWFPVKGFSLQDVKAETKMFFRVKWTENGEEKVFETNPFTKNIITVVKECKDANKYTGKDLTLAEKYIALYDAANATNQEIALGGYTVTADDNYISSPQITFNPATSGLNFYYAYSGTTFSTDILKPAKDTGTRKLFFLLDVAGTKYEFEMDGISSGYWFPVEGFSIGDLSGAVSGQIKVTWTNNEGPQEYLSNKMVFTSAIDSIAASDSTIATVYSEYIAALNDYNS